MQENTGKSRIVVALSFGALFLGACSYNGAERPGGKESGARYLIGKPYEVAGRVYTPREDFAYSRIGFAAVTSSGFEGRRTRSGELYAAGALTAAHPTLPMPTYVRVTNLDNDRAVVVKINDRGPFRRGHIIELSQAAADRLQISRRDRTRVQVTVLKRRTLEAKRRILGGADPAAAYRSTASAFEVRRSLAERRTTTPNRNELSGRRTTSRRTVSRQGPEGLGSEEARALRLARINTAAGPGSIVRPVDLHRSERAVLGRYWIQVGSFTKRANASTASSDLRDIARPQIAALRVHGTRYYRVRLGPFRTREEARRALERIRSMDYPDAKILVK